jgi:hypothetical protein
VIAQTQKDQAQQIHCNGTVTEGPGEKIAKLQPNEIDLTESWSKARIHIWCWTKHLHFNQNHISTNGRTNLNDDFPALQLQSDAAE